MCHLIQIILVYFNRFLLSRIDKKDNNKNDEERKISAEWVIPKSSK